jgi:hypothetical protein
MTTASAPMSPAPQRASAVTVAPTPSDATKGVGLDAHEARLRRDGFTVLERIVPLAERDPRVEVVGCTTWQDALDEDD